MSVTLYSGKSAAFGAETSAIHKTAISLPRYCSPLGLAEDEVADPRFHGGSERALHYYPAEHYPFWEQMWQSLALTPSPTPFQGGAFGENLSETGWTERNVCIGDRFRLGEVLLEVSEPRCPCHKINTRFNYSQLAMLVQLTGRSGWFFRVITPGEIKQGDSLKRVHQDERSLSVARCMEILYGQQRQPEQLKRLTEHPKLTQVWQNHAIKWLENEQAADWSRRLFGHPTTSQ
ncbi:MOSC domain-containing protein YiiM [Ferrimonas sediminum]|uniref:MOSC domain-containing protein YiiM n=1 Tax=Ferrimonas sediminum TaxID=718193 RepID=A0A1G8STB2_9GAMM|nr:MOSC domain-containing protein [Ferrimonas sediminum]SDJ32477.1 MOSC domain-containing protein YiiM [Ferrimonas sediminum]